ncbi:hypothetical protein D3C81_2215070 [compost metagenome]
MEGSGGNADRDDDNTQRLGHLFYGYRLYGLYALALSEKTCGSRSRAGQEADGKRL